MKLTIKLLMLLGFSALTSQVMAGASTAIGKITYLENGWYGEGFAIHLTAGLPGCSSSRLEFAVLASHPSYKDIVALSASAFMSSANVQLVVEQGVCVFGNRTKILSIRLWK